MTTIQPDTRPAIQCECGAYWCHRDHDEEAARAGQTPAV